MAEPTRIRVVRAAIAASTTSAADSGKSSVRCSPIPKKSTPTWPARTPCSTTLRMVFAWASGRSASSWVTSPNVSRPEAQRKGPRRLAAHVDALRRIGTQGALELRSAKRRAEDRAARLEQAAGGQAPQPDGVVAHPLDDADRAPRRRPRRLPPIL